MRYPWDKDAGDPLTEELVRELDDFENGSFSEREKAALRFVEKFNYNHLAFGDGDMDALRRHFTEEEILELAQVTGGYLFRHRLNEVMGIEH